MRSLYKKRFLDEFDRLSPADQALVRAADREIRATHETSLAAPGVSGAAVPPPPPTGSGRASAGLRIKKLHHRGEASLYEARPSLGLRMIWARRGEMISFLLLGTHDEVRRFLKHLA